MTDDPRPSSPEARMAIGDIAVKAYGPYCLVRKLAEGGMAEIFLAKQVGVEGFEKNVVIKRMLPHLSEVPDFVSMFLDEARLAASLTHSNIVQISDLGFADGCYFICMEYLAGEDFATVLRTAKRRGEQAPVTIVLRVVMEAAVGLHFAHDAVDAKGEPMHLVHRDISPSNIFVTYSGQVKLLDFGIAKAESRLTSTGAGVVKGKYQYMSPEQARGDSIDRRSDIFSLGVSMYEALTGIRPFARETDLGVLKAVLSGDFQPLRSLRPDLPHEIEFIVVKAMALEPGERYGSALELAQDIEKYLGATTSASGGQALAHFMTGFFGPERVKSKTRIESLTEMAQRGVQVPGLNSAKVDRTSASLTGVSQAAIATISSPGAALRSPKPSAALATEAVTPRPASAKLLVAGAVVATVVLTVVVMKLLAPSSQSEVAPEVLVADAGSTGPVAEVDAGSVEVDAGSVVVVDEVADAGVQIEPVDAGRRVTKPSGPVSLTSAMVDRAVRQQKSRFQQCFKTYQGELPAVQGTLKVSFTIVSSGKVTQASTDLPGSQVSKCVESVVRQMTFPRHVDFEVSMRVALTWDVR